MAMVKQAMQNHRRTYEEMKMNFRRSCVHEQPAIGSIYVGRLMWTQHLKKGQENKI